MDPIPMKELLILAGVLAKYTPAIAYDKEATTHNIDANKSKLPDGPTSRNKPENPIKTPESLKYENSPLYSVNRINAVSIGTVACKIEREPAPSDTEAYANIVKGSAVFSNPINKNEKPCS